MSANPETAAPTGRKKLAQGKERSAALAEQTRIVAEVERRWSVVVELEAVVCTNSDESRDSVLQRATRLRQSILQKAFTGELAGDAKPQQPKA
jgi:DUF1009 family protein